MVNIFVVGLVNLETTVQIEGFPLEYAPVRYPFFGIGSGPSGVGLNVALALQTLGAKVRLSTLLGEDLAGQMVRARLEGLGMQLALEGMPDQPQSVILLDAQGKRAIHTDLKDIQERRFSIPTFELALAGVDAAVICNINFARPALQIAKQRKIPIYTDLHAIEHLDNPYDQEFLQAAMVLFVSAERLADPQHTAKEALERFPNLERVIMGAGEQGAWLFERGKPAHLEPSVPNAQIKSTIGAGDALFSSFVYFQVKTKNARLALARAVCFASHKLGSMGGASGFVSELELEGMMQKG
jgi:acarbose 7IV-phosphotransferase